MPELLGEKLEHPLVGGVVPIDEVHDDDIVLLAIAMTPADALLDAPRVPREIEVDDQRTELTMKC